MNEAKMNRVLNGGFFLVIMEETLWQLCSTFIRIIQNDISVRSFSFSFAEVGHQDNWCIELGHFWTSIFTSN